MDAKSKYELDKARGCTAWDYEKKRRAWAKDLTEWPLVMNQGQLAAILGVRQSTLSRWFREGYGPRPFVLGPRKVRYSKQDVLDWMETMKDSTDEYMEQRLRGSHLNNIKVKPRGAKPKPTEEKGVRIPSHLVFRNEK